MSITLFGALAWHLLDATWGAQLFTELLGLLKVVVELGRIDVLMVGISYDFQTDCIGSRCCKTKQLILFFWQLSLVLSLIWISRGEDIIHQWWWFIINITWLEFYWIVDSDCDNSALRTSKKLGSQLYTRRDKVSTEVNLFRLFKEFTIILWIYLIMWLLEVIMQPAWLYGTSTDE